MSPNNARTTPAGPSTRSKSTVAATSKDHTKQPHPTDVNNLEDGRTYLEDKGYLTPGEQF